MRNDRTASNSGRPYRNLYPARARTGVPYAHERTAEARRISGNAVVTGDAPQERPRAPALIDLWFMPLRVWVAILGARR